MEEEREGSTERIVIPLVHVGLPVRVRMNKKNAQPRGIRQIRLVLCFWGPRSHTTSTRRFASVGKGGWCCRVYFS